MVPLIHCPGIYFWEQSYTENSEMGGLKNTSNFPQLGIYGLLEPFALWSPYNDLASQAGLRFP